MTTETENKAAGNEQEQSILPTVLAGAGILAVAALLIFWPSDDDAKTEGAKDQKAKVGASSVDNSAAAAAGGGARGVASRPVDAPTTPATRRVNPDIKLPATRGMAPTIPEAAPKDPPPEATHDEKIAFYEKRLEQAVRNRDNRKKFADKLPDVKAKIEQSPNAAAQLQTFEQREKIVQDNLTKAEAEVAEIEQKLAELRGA